MCLCISRHQHNQLLTWAHDAGEQECCGIMLGQDNIVEEMLLADNVAPDPATHFEINPTILIAAEKAARDQGAAIIGYFHSHPNGLAQPSATDATMTAADGRYWVILTNETVTAWRAVVNGMLHSRFDPVPLVIDSNAKG